MKPILREYLASLRERQELDAILPDLVSELGHTVLTRPGIGTTQYGIDFTSVGPDAQGETRLYLYVIKAGNLTRAAWTQDDQGVRASLEAAKDVYIPQHIPVEHRGLKVVICICFGGELTDNCRPYLTGYVDREASDRVGFEVWNGDHIAGLLQGGLLREELLPKPLRAAFRKAVALVDEPDVSVHHFVLLVGGLLDQAKSSDKTRLTALRQLYIALWILYVWSRDADNLEAPCKASELALLAAWEMLKPLMGRDSAAASGASRVIDQLVQLHMGITGNFLETKILVHAGRRHGLSLAVATRNAIDVNLRMFDILGRLAIYGLWYHWRLQQLGDAATPEHRAYLEGTVRKTFRAHRQQPRALSPQSRRAGD